MRLRLAALAGAATLLLMACQPQTGEDSAAIQPMTPEEEQAAEPIGPVGWLEADGPGETALLYRAGPNAIDFVLTCSQAQKLLTVTAEPPGAVAAPNAKVKIFIGAAGFDAIGNPAGDSLLFQAETPVTPALLQAFANAPSARIVLGEASTEAGPDGAAKLKTFGETCAMLTGVKPAP